MGGVNLVGRDLTQVYLAGAVLPGANLEGANLSGRYLAETDFGMANLAEADLSKAFLMQSILMGTKLFGADLRGVQMDEKTMLPDGTFFNPELDRKEQLDVFVKAYWLPLWIKPYLEFIERQSKDKAESGKKDNL